MKFSHGNLAPKEATIFPMNLFFFSVDQPRTKDLDLCLHRINLKYIKKHCVYERSDNAILNCKVWLQPNETVFVA